MYLPTNERIAMIVILSHQATTGEWVEDFECELSDRNLAQSISTYIRNDIKFNITPLE